jgi:hypothetical protein
MCDKLIRRQKTPIYRVTGMKIITVYINDILQIFYLPNYNAKLYIG